MSSEKRPKMCLLTIKYLYVVVSRTQLDTKEEANLRSSGNTRKTEDPEKHNMQSLKRRDSQKERVKFLLGNAWVKGQSDVDVCASVL